MGTNIYTWKTASVIRETKDAVTIIFDTGGHEFVFKAGQFINLSQVIEGSKVTRSYSLSSSGCDGEKPAITIRKVDGGIMSTHIYNRAEEIKHWQVEGPYGLFFVDANEVSGKTIVMLGGGSGITPLYSIIKTLLKQSDASIFLIDCNRSWDDVLFAKGLTSLEQAYSDRFKVHHFLSQQKQENVPDCKNFSREKLNRISFKKLLKKLPAKTLTEAQYFLCGPSGLMKFGNEILESLRVASTQIHLEHFTGAEEEKNLFSLPQTTKEVLLHYYEQSNLLEVKPGSNILESALNDKIPLRYSCKAGTCGSCAAKLIAGEVHFTQNFALTEEHLEQGLILLCQSYPLNDEVVVVIE